MERHKNMTNLQFKVFLINLLEVVRKAKSIEEIAEHLESLIKSL